MIGGRRDRWWAICIDLDVAADGPSASEARQNLEGAIGLYLERIAELPPEEQHRMLGRRSPWYLRAQFVARSFAARLVGTGGQRQFNLSASIPSHA